MIFLVCFNHLKIKASYYWSGASPVDQRVKKPPAMQETQEAWVQSPVGKILWIRAQQLTPVFLPGGISWTEEPGVLQSIGSQTAGHYLK